MVLHAKKPIEFYSNPPELETYGSLDQLWEIRETGELFMRYEDYLARRDFYVQKNFSCEITRRNNLSFFEALESEKNTTRELKSAFPKALRRPILKHVHHSTVGRLEQLVTIVHDTFKEDFFPGEHVICSAGNGEKFEGVIREKLIKSGLSSYRVQVKPDQSDDNMFEASFDPSDLSRDRRHFSKNLIRSYLKNALTKETWQGAPWQVIEALAIECNLPLEIPVHLQQSTRIAEKKAMKKAQQENRISEASMFTITDWRHHPHGKKGPPANGLVGEPTMHQPWQSKPSGKKTKFVTHNFNTNGNSVQHLEVDWRQYPIGPEQKAQLPNGSGQVQEFVLYPHDQSPRPQGSIYQQASGNGNAKKEGQPVSVAVPIKYPIDDLDVPIKKQASSRPKFKSYVDSLVLENDMEFPTGQYDEKSIGSLLEVWNTLNVHNEVFLLDSFTFDDFAEAMRFFATDFECELLAEVHCAVLSQMVDAEGVLQVDLPNIDNDTNSDDDDEEEVEEEKKPEVHVTRRTTRRSLAQLQAQPVISTPAIIHRAAELEAQYPWKEECQTRHFKVNGWQVILVGLIYQLSRNDIMKERCEAILKHLVPPDLEPVPDTVIDQYANLDVNLRLDALEIMVMLAVRTKAIRENLEKMSLEMTDLRKRKIEQQRTKKELMDQLQELDSQRKDLAADVEANHQEAEKKVKDEESEMPDVSKINGHKETSEESEDDAPRQLRGNQIIVDRKRKRRAEVARKEQERKEKATATKLSKSEIKLKKAQDQMAELKDEIKECEESINELNNDLRQTDCQRTKCLGRDRFCNRYFFFERNGLSYGDISDNSNFYGNGRLWIQGADPMESSGLFDLSKDDQLRYKACFGISIEERRNREEGESHLLDSNHWGYIDDIESFDVLISWLDDRGLREKALRKELQTWRDVIVECMQKLNDRLDEEEAERVAQMNSDESDDENLEGEEDDEEDEEQEDEDEDEEQEESVEPKEEVVTNGDTKEKSGSVEKLKPPAHDPLRNRTYVDLDNTTWRCMNWQNLMAQTKLGHKHSEEKRFTRKRGPKPRGTKAASTPVVGVATRKAALYAKPTRRSNRRY